MPLPGIGNPPLLLGVRKSLLKILQDLGLTTNLQLCLDAGDSASYSSGQSFLDRSGNGYDFFLGATSGAEASDPTFNGSSGGLSLNEYFSHDGGDYFTYDTTNETWMQNLHKDNATYTCLAAIYHPNASGSGLWGTNGGNLVTGTGANVLLNNNNVGVVAVNAGSTALSATSTINFGDNVWSIIAVALDEAAGAAGSHFRINGNTETFTGTYASPAAGNASHTLQIGSRGNANAPIQSGSRLACFAMWSTDLSTTQTGQIYDALRGRFAI